HSTLRPMLGAGAQAGLMKHREFLQVVRDHDLSNAYPRTGSWISCWTNLMWQLWFFGYGQT
ncbi:hypothetical protein, partial [Streptomyces misionensis]|uniref:hypothetical protein n=1 Tax=Streptomyces misionensis TaxID=67331 RepID=UPI0036961156